MTTTDCRICGETHEVGDNCRPRREWEAKHLAEARRVAKTARESVRNRPAEEAP